jgi:hypothetical protein
MEGLSPAQILALPVEQQASYISSLSSTRAAVPSSSVGVSAGTVTTDTGYTYSPAAASIVTQQINSAYQPSLLTATSAQDQKIVDSTENIISQYGTKIPDSTLVTPKINIPTGAGATTIINTLGIKSEQNYNLSDFLNKGITPAQLLAAGFKQSDIDSALAYNNQLAQFNANNVKLDTGEYVSKDSFNALDTASQNILMRRGIDAFNRYNITQTESQAQYQNYINQNYVKLDNGEYVDKSYYNNLSKSDQARLSSLGVDKFNTQQSNANVQQINNAFYNSNLLGSPAAVAATLAGSSTSGRSTSIPLTAGGGLDFSKWNPTGLNTQQFAEQQKSREEGLANLPKGGIYDKAWTGLDKYISNQISDVNLASKGIQLQTQNLPSWLAAPTQIWDNLLLTIGRPVGAVAAPVYSFMDAPTWTQKGDVLLNVTGLTQISQGLTGKNWTGENLNLTSRERQIDVGTGAFQWGMTLWGAKGIGEAGIAAFSEPKGLGIASSDIVSAVGKSGDSPLYARTAINVRDVVNSAKEIPGKVYDFAVSVPDKIDTLGTFVNAKLDQMEVIGDNLISGKYIKDMATATRDTFVNDIHPALVNAVKDLRSSVEDGYFKSYDKISSAVSTINDITNKVVNGGYNDAIKGQILALSDHASDIAFKVGNHIEDTYHTAIGKANDIISSANTVGKNIFSGKYEDLVDAKIQNAYDTLSTKIPEYGSKGYNAVIDKYYNAVGTLDDFWKVAKAAPEKYSTEFVGKLGDYVNNVKGGLAQVPDYYFKTIGDVDSKITSGFKSFNKMLDDLEKAPDKYYKNVSNATIDKFYNVVESLKNSVVDLKDNISSLQKSVPDKYWETVGKLDDNYWKTIGKLDNAVKTLDKLSKDISSGKFFDDLEKNAKGKIADIRATIAEDISKTAREKEIRNSILDDLKQGLKTDNKTLVNSAANRMAAFSRVVKGGQSNILSRYADYLKVNSLDVIKNGETAAEFESRLATVAKEQAELERKGSMPVNISETRFDGETLSIISPKKVLPDFRPIMQTTSSGKPYVIFERVPVSEEEYFHFNPSSTSTVPRTRPGYIRGGGGGASVEHDIRNLSGTYENPYYGNQGVDVGIGKGFYIPTVAPLLTEVPQIGGKGSEIVSPNISISPNIVSIASPVSGIADISKLQIANAVDISAFTGTSPSNAIANITGVNPATETNTNIQTQPSVVTQPIVITQPVVTTKTITETTTKNVDTNKPPEPPKAKLEFPLLQHKKKDKKKKKKIGEQGYKIESYQNLFGKQPALELHYPTGKLSGGVLGGQIEERRIFEVEPEHKGEEGVRLNTRTYGRVRGNRSNDYRGISRYSALGTI